MRLLTSEDCVNAFVVDDSLYECTSCKEGWLGPESSNFLPMNYLKSNCL